MQLHVGGDIGWNVFRWCWPVCGRIIRRFVRLRSLGRSNGKQKERDSKHYKVEFENDQVRVLRITYGPHEKSVMHAHPASVAVFLTDGQGKFTLPDGTTQEVPIKAGATQWDGGGKHLPENTGDKPFDLILVELKSKPATAK